MDLKMVTYPMSLVISMFKACIFPKSLTKLGQIFKSMNCANVLMHSVK